MSFKDDPKKVDKIFMNHVEKLLGSYPNLVLPITQVGEPVLRQRCKTYNSSLPSQLLRKLITAMKVTMRKAPGVGLAATQIGLDYAIAVIEDVSVEPEYDPIADEDDKETYHLPFFTVINPRYEPIGIETRTFYEGCLSFRDFYAVRSRFHTIRAFWQDEKGRSHEQVFKGWPARIFQHETDHLYGEVFIDKAELRSLTNVQNYQKFDLGDNLDSTANLLNFELPN